MHFDDGVPKQLHGYRLRAADDDLGEPDCRAMLFDVDHQKRTASSSAVGARLLDANLLDGGGMIEARVVKRDHEGVHFSYEGTALLLRCNGLRDYARLTPESLVEVYPEVWTLEEIVSRQRRGPLGVRMQPRVDGSRKHWSPIPLSIDEARLPLLVKADELISDASLDEAPWRVHLLDSGQVAFTLGTVTLVTTVSTQHHAFALDDVVFGQGNPPLSIRFHASLAAFVPETDDDEETEREHFIPFVAAIHEELASQKQSLLQRKTALRLRKLSLIYKDQQEHLQNSGVCGFLTGESQKGGRVVVGTLAQTPAPAWLASALSGTDEGRLRAVGEDAAWNISRASWIEPRLGICRLELEAPDGATELEIKPFELTRLELTNAGSQEQVLSRALENAILGKFVSGGVHAELLELSGKHVPNENSGRDAVASVLRSDARVVAIWGPPGTGKTTLLVEWLLSLFDPLAEASWPSVLVTAPTHVAITKLVTDLLAREGRLSDETVRYGSEQRVRGTTLEPLWNVRLMEKLRLDPGPEMRDAPSRKRWNEILKSREGREAAAKWLLGPRHIHVATCGGMSRREFALSNRSFDIAIIDEAGKAFGAELLVPAAVARRVILVGDHNQLPPTVTTDELNEDIGYRLPLDEVEQLLRRNMFQEFFEQLPVESKGMLTLQHRMHEDIGDAVSALFYDGKLESARKDRDWTLTSQRLVFVDFSKVKAYLHEKSDTSPSIENKLERRALKALLQRLESRSRGKRFSLLIVCPYEAQRAAVVRDLRSARFTFDVKVTTVDAVQGGEADMVVLLMTRSHGRTQFLLDRHRLNVALSRARDAVVVLGHFDCLTRDGEGPIAELVRRGKDTKTLDFVQMPRVGDLHKHLGERVVP